MRTFLAACALAMMSAASAADRATQLASCMVPTAAEKVLCTPDAHRLCSEAIPRGVFAVLFCLKANRARLSAACAAILIQCGQ
jgi:hypothetical protein